MNYTYDIYLNLNKYLYDFFDWNKNDKLTHIRKAPIFKVKEETLSNLINNIIKLDDSFYNLIKDKTILWDIKNSTISLCLFATKEGIVAIEFDKKGISKNKSYLMVDEELEVLEIVNRLPYKDIEFSVIKKDKYYFKTRKEISSINFVDNELKKIDINKLDYIFFECFGKHENNKDIILKKIKKLDKNSKVYKNLYDILKLTSTSKK